MHTHSQQMCRFLCTASHPVQPSLEASHSCAAALAMLSSFPGAGPLWEQRVDSSGRVYFYNTDDHSFYEQLNAQFQKRPLNVEGDLSIDTASPTASPGVVRRLPGGIKYSDRQIFEKAERRFDTDFELRSFKEFERKYHPSTTSASVVRVPAQTRWLEARSRTIGMRLRMATFERRLLKPIKWAVARHQDTWRSENREPAPFKPVYYARATGEVALNLPTRLERFRRHEVDGFNGPEFGTWDPKRMHFHDGALKRPHADGPIAFRPSADRRQITDADRELVKIERNLRCRASTTPALHENLEGRMSFDPPPTGGLADAEECFVRMHRPHKTRRTVLQLDESARQLEPGGRWMPVFDFGPEPFNLPRDADGYYALLEPGEKHDVKYFSEQRIPQFIPYNGLFLCSGCKKSGSDSISGMSTDAYCLVQQRAELAVRERDLARSALAKLQVENDQLRLKLANCPTAEAASTDDRDGARATAPPPVPAPLAPADDDDDQRAPAAPAAAPAPANFKAKKKRQEEGSRLADKRARVQNGLPLTRSAIDEHGSEMLRAFLEAMGLPIRPPKADMQARLRCAFERAGISTWKIGDRRRWLDGC